MLLLTTLIDLCLIFAVWRFYREEPRRTVVKQKHVHPVIRECISNSLKGEITVALRKSAIAEKFAERAFSLASTANLSCMYIQKSLATRPAFVSHQKQLQNEIIQTEVQKAIGGTTQDMAGFDWLYPCLSDEERDLIDKALDHSAKYREEPKK